METETKTERIGFGHRF